MDDDTVLFILFDKLCDVFVEMFDHIGADGVGTLPSLTPIGNRLKGKRAATQAALGIVIQSGLKRFVFDGLTDSFAEYFGRHAAYL
jgi:hypothetical protein